MGHNWSFIQASWFILCCTPTLSISSPSLFSTSPVLLSSSSPNPDQLSTYPIIHCDDPRQDGTSTEYHSSTSHEPKRIELNSILVKPQNQTVDDQDDVEEIGVKPLSYSQSWIHSAYYSAESIATPPDLDLEDEQFRKMLDTEVLVKPDPESVQAYHSERGSLMSSCSRDLEASGKPGAVFSCHSESSQNTFSKRDRSNDTGKRFESSVHSVFRIADPAKCWKISS